MNRQVKTIGSGLAFCALLLGAAPLHAQELTPAPDKTTAAAPATPCTNTTDLAAGVSALAICSSAAFTSGANSTVNGDVSAQAAVTLGATSRIHGSVKTGGAFTSGDRSVVSGDVTAAGDVSLGAYSRITGSVHSDTGVITYGAGATVGKVVK
jgi:UDP-3-O-[3-hydroxymyristoyl] glucosamine N-acyltransferase